MHARKTAEGAPSRRLDSRPPRAAVPVHRELYAMSRGQVAVKPGEIMTLQGSTLTAVVSSADVRVNGARITQANMAATNGIVHAIDTVILPKNWQLLAVAA